MKKKDYKLEDYKVKMYGKPVSGKSYSEENAMLFEDKKEEQGKDMKKHKKLSSGEYYFRYNISAIIGFLISLIGILLEKVWIQRIGAIIFLLVPFYLFLFFKRRDEEEEEEK